MRRRLQLITAAILLLSGAGTLAAWRSGPAPIPMRVVKSPSCGCCGEWIKYMEKNGFKVRITDRRETPSLTEGMLREYSQLWVLWGESGPGQSFTRAELETVGRFTAQGKSMLIVAGNQGPGANDMTAVNQLASRYGAVFSGAAGGKEAFPVSTGSYFFTRTSEALRSILKLVHKA